MAANTELGKAYVQIIPSAQGISGKITQALGGESASAGQAAGESWAQKLVSTAKKAMAAAGIGKALSIALTEGTALEQAIGGVETLYGDAAETIKAYAKDAFRTAGLSANEYMEQSTSFAAALVSSLGGDTAAAAEAANTALTDMSDNANKMGTDMADIQNAYQGFAKGNYTMLDNLKLGYGGTQSEMKRLLADAQKLAGVKYDINNLADVYSASLSGRTYIGANSRYTMFGWLPNYAPSFYPSTGGPTSEFVGLFVDNVSSLIHCCATKFEIPGRIECASLSVNGREI